MVTTRKNDCSPLKDYLIGYWSWKKNTIFKNQTRIITRITASMIFSSSLRSKLDTDSWSFFESDVSLRGRLQVYPHTYAETHADSPHSRRKVLLRDQSAALIGPKSVRVLLTFGHIQICNWPSITVVQAGVTRLHVCYAHGFILERDMLLEFSWFIIDFFAPCWSMGTSQIEVAPLGNCLYFCY